MPPPRSITPTSSGSHSDSPVKGRVARVALERTALAPRVPDGLLVRAAGRVSVLLAPSTPVALAGAVPLEVELLLVVLELFELELVLLDVFELVLLEVFELVLLEVFELVLLEVFELVLLDVFELELFDVLPAGELVDATAVQLVEAE
jgi:hypothetical protein